MAQNRFRSFKTITFFVFCKEPAHERAFVGRRSEKLQAEIEKPALGTFEKE